MSNDYTYSVVFRNQSSNANYGCLYQTLPSTSSVAWMSKYVFPTTTVTWSWTTEYDFVWSESGQLQAGTMMSASQVWPADLVASNVVTLTHQHDAYTFQNQRAGPPSGSLLIYQDNTIPLNRASVGIGMAGYATNVVQAQPNVSVPFAAGTERLWITFGPYPRGQVIDPALTTSMELVFPANIYSLTATLSMSNQWTVESTSAVNARFAEAVQDDRHASWSEI